MQVTSPTSATSTTLADSGSGQTATPKKTALGQADFMKLLSVQFQQQDPMKPMDDTAFIAQMAQFTALDQSSSLLAQITQLNTKQDAVTANSYIGRNVTVNDGHGGTATGDVTGVDMSSGTPQLVVGGANYPVASVLLVQPVNPSTAAPLSNPTP
jgi:flagellar basal-body rod modification protein FlgD